MAIHPAVAAVAAQPAIAAEPASASATTAPTALLDSTDQLVMPLDLAEADAVFPAVPTPPKTLVASADPIAPPKTPALPAAAAVTGNTGNTSLDAEKAFDRGDAKNACQIAEPITTNAPSDLRALAVFGECNLALGNAQAARTAFSNALATDPTYHRARIGLARAEANLGDKAAARADFARVLADNPPTDEAYKIVDAMTLLQSVTPVAQLSSNAN
jgi:tetratricopeptide (TPR) repeat protein